MTHIDLIGKTILLTGSAGFIGSNLVMELLRTQPDIRVIGIDNMSDYYDVRIKEWRQKEIDKLAEATPCIKYTFIKCDISDRQCLIIRQIKNTDSIICQHIKMTINIIHAISKRDINSLDYFRPCFVGLVLIYNFARHITRAIPVCISLIFAAT